jgi:hypothetical protein
VSVDSAPGIGTFFGNTDTGDVTLISTDGTKIYKGRGDSAFNLFGGQFAQYCVTSNDTANFSGYIDNGAGVAGNVLTVTSVSSGTLSPGQLVVATGIQPATFITSQTSGTTGGVGVYAVSTTFATAGQLLGSSGSPVAMVTTPDNYGNLTTNRFYVSSNRKSPISGRRGALKSGDTLYNFQFSGQNGTTGGGYGNTGGGSVAAQMQFYATGDYTPTSAPSAYRLNLTPSGSVVMTSALEVSLPSSTVYTDSFTFKNSTGSTQITGNNINYNRVYGQWQYDTTITPAAANTAYVFPLGTVDFANIASVGSTTHLIPGAAGMYKTQFSVQVNNADNGSEHTAFIWWRLNGVDVPGSMGRVTVPKGGQTIAGWDNMIQSSNATDYWELAYAVDSTQLTFPSFASTAFGPSTACLFTTLIPVGI